MTERRITRRIRGIDTADGAGVKLKRVIGQPGLDMLDPFLLLDEFRSDQAGDYIAGYSVANDYGLHDFRDTDAGSMLRVKGSDTLCPIGPGLVTGWDFRNKAIRTYVNGVVRQEGNTSEMEWDMHYLVADIARTITLEPGDVLLSGTPANSRSVQPGDVVEVEVEGLGRLSNTIVRGPTPIRDDVGAQPTESEEVISTAMGGDWEHRGKRAARGAGSAHYESAVEEK